MECFNDLLIQISFMCQLLYQTKTLKNSKIRIRFKINRIKMLLIFLKCKRPVLIEFVNLKEDNKMNNFIDRDNYSKLMSRMKLCILYTTKIMKICFTFKRIEKKLFKNYKSSFSDTVTFVSFDFFRFL